MHVYANRHTGDSLACRHYHLGVAATFPSGSSQSQLHCGHAGPTGAGVCVGNPLPTEFCTDFLETCGADSAWPDATTCAFNVDFMVTGTPTASMEDTYGCRLAFLRAAKGFVAGTSNRSTSCARASYSGADGWCQGPVTAQSFCQQFVDTCGTADYGWDSVASCTWWNRRMATALGCKASLTTSKPPVASTLLFALCRSAPK
eukprot:m.1465415 g.1465415  ORF g.1465415 m.1465415 type:complete len:202 (+) comp25136_c0_seq14:1712-2317(+)